MSHFLVTRFLLKPILLSYIFSVGISFNFVVHAEDSFFSGTAVNQEINTILTTKKNPLLIRSNFEYRAEDVESLYKNNNNDLLW